MPEHTSWFTYLMALPGIRNLEQSLEAPGTYPAHTPVTLEFTALAIFVILLIVLLSLVVRARVSRVEQALLPEGKLTVTSFMENFIEAFYGMLRDTLGPKDAKIFLPIIGTCAVFIFFSNALGLVPGFVPPTSNLNVTLACGIIIMVVTQAYGLKRNGLAYLKHFVGPVPFLAPLMLVLEIFTHFLVRPITLGFRLMVNMFVDHLVVGLFTVLVPLLLPLPVMVMGLLVVMVQTYVFCLLSAVYIKMAIEHHDDHEGHGHQPHHGHELQEAPIP